MAADQVKRHKREKKTDIPLSKQVRAKVEKDKADDKEDSVGEAFEPYAGNTKRMTSTGCTLLDLAISGGVTRKGGIPSGIYVEVSGPESTGKTVVLVSTAGYIQRQGGEARFQDPETRLDTQFAKIFDMSIDPDNIDEPDTVNEVFANIRKWKPKNPDAVNGIFVDSLAALSTEVEMENEEGDKMGGRRGKDFSVGFRKTMRILKEKDLLLMCSNQLRDTMDGTGRKESPGGWALKFYASLRIKVLKSEKIFKEIEYVGKNFKDDEDVVSPKKFGKTAKKEKSKTISIKKQIGIATTFEIVKSSVWKAGRTATVYIIWDYGIDNVRGNLQFIKDFTGANTYTLNGRGIGVGMDQAIKYIESNNLEKELEDETIEIWNEIEEKFNSVRKPKTL